MKSITTVEHKLKGLQKKLDILFRKKKVFGLTVKESNDYKELQTQFYVLHDEFIDLKLDAVLLTHLHSKDTIVALKEIQSLVPWNGGFVVRESEFESILESELSLTEKQREMISNNLIKIHREVLDNFEKMADKEDLADFLMDLGKFVSQSVNGDISDLVQYIDSRYRDFGELLGIELDELEIEWLDL